MAAETAIKYNVGDRVYVLNRLCFIDNPYHFETALNAFKTVKGADPKRFTVYDVSSLDISDVYGWQLNHQDNGQAFDSNEVLLHVEKDREAILRAIDSTVQEALAEAEEKKREKIKGNRAKIKALEAEISDIEQNGITFGFSPIRMVAFVTENKKRLLEKLES